MHAVILAGGKGTRLRPLTDSRPKPLLPFAGDPFAAGLLRRLHAVGCDRATFLVGRDAEPFAELRYLGLGLGVEVDVVTEPQPLDTAGAARDLLHGRTDGPVIVCNGDILTDLDYGALLAAHAESGAMATLALTRVEDTSTFGVVDIDADQRVRRFVEKPPPGTVDADTVNAGTYVLSPGAFEGCPTVGPLSFERVVLPTLVNSGAVVLGIPSEAFWLDLGTPARYLEGHRSVLTGRCHWPLGEAFTRLGSVLVHHDARVEKGAMLDDCVVVGPGATVGAGARVTRSAIFEDVEIGAGATVSDAIIGEGVQVAQGALVNDTVLAPYART
jgi:mannose-1-phosphate guanylyltransferase